MTEKEFKSLCTQLGTRLRDRRVRAGWTQEDMIGFGFSARHWQQVEAGRPITIKTLLRACLALKTSPTVVLEGLDRGLSPIDPPPTTKSRRRARSRR